MLSVEADKISNELNISQDCLLSPKQFALENKGAVIQEDFKRYKDNLKLTIDENLKLIDELPPLKHLSKTEIKKFLSKKLEERLKKDETFEKAVELEKYVSGINRYLGSYYKEIFGHHDNCRERLESRLLDLYRMYYNSDLPLDFLKASENSILLERDFLDIYDNRLRKEHLSLITSRNNRKKFEKLCETHNKWVKPFDKIIENMDELRVKLFWYIDFSNSKTLKEIFKVKKIRSASVDLKVIENYVEQLKKLDQDAGVIIEKRLDFQPIQKYDEENGSRTIREIMELLNISEV